MGFSISGPCHRRQGFTLIELLMVVSVIVLLASLLLPAVRMVREAALGARCGSQARQLGAGVLQYAQDAEGVLPPPALPYPNTAYPSAAFRTWADLLVDLDDGLAALLDCPAHQKATRWTYANAWNHSYLFNNQYWNVPSQDIAQAPLGRVFGSTVLFADGASWYKFVTVANTTIDTVASPQRWTSGWSGWPGELVARHGRKLNAACADGHVEALGLAELSATNAGGLYPLLTRSKD